MSLTIRNASLSDAGALAVLMCELGYETDRTEMEARLKLVLSNAAYKTFVAVMDGCVCGMIGAGCTNGAALSARCRRKVPSVE